ncbi:MAG: HAMP domain-containing protein [Candidatus Omnitrophica bacterium]|nr:HAMP domain-containing protein [Candidatus Omnitrophota bacterium]
MEPEKQQLKRRQYIVDPAYQLRFVTRVFLIVLAVAVPGSFIATGLVWSTMYRPELGSQTHLIVAIESVAMTLLAELILALPIVFFLSIRQSHRIVGPITRIKQCLEGIGAGDFSQRIHLRKGDVLDDLAKAINAMAENLQRRGPGGSSGSSPSSS